MPDQRSIAHTLAYPPEPPIVVACCMTFGLKRAEARALMCLMEGGFVSRADLHAAMYAGSTPTSKPKIIDVIVCHLRKKVAGHGVKIITVHGQGFQLARGACDKIRRLIAKEPEAA